MLLTAYPPVLRWRGNPTRVAVIMTPAKNIPVDLSEDRAWLTDFRAGKPGALERLVRTYAPYVVAILRRGYRKTDGGAQVLGIVDGDEQRELMQEVFVRVLGPQSRERYNGITPYSVFLRAVVGNVMLEHLRKKTTAQQRVDLVDHLEDITPQPWVPSVPLPDELFLDEEDRRLVRAFMETLDERQQAFVQKRYFEGLSQQDAADALGIGRQSIRTLETVVRKRFTDYMAVHRKECGWGADHQPKPPAP